MCVGVGEVRVVGCAWWVRAVGCAELCIPCCVGVVGAETAVKMRRSDAPLRSGFAFISPERGSYHGAVGDGVGAWRVGAGWVGCQVAACFPRGETIRP